MLLFAIMIGIAIPSVYFAVKSGHRKTGPGSPIVESILLGLVEVFIVFLFSLLGNFSGEAGLLMSAFLLYFGAVLFICAVTVGVIVHFCRPAAPDPQGSRNKALD